MIKTVKTFYFNKAEYFVGDGNGSKVLLKIDYQHKKFDLESTGENNTDLLKETQQIGRKLIKRKHNVNFVDRLK